MFKKLATLAWKKDRMNERERKNVVSENLSYYIRKMDFSFSQIKYNNGFINIFIRRVPHHKTDISLV